MYINIGTLTIPKAILRSPELFYQLVGFIHRSQYQTAAWGFYMLDYHQTISANRPRLANYLQMVKSGDFKGLTAYDQAHPQIQGWLDHLQAQSDPTLAFYCQTDQPFSKWLLTKWPQILQPDDKTPRLAALFGNLCGCFINKNLSLTFKISSPTDASAAEPDLNYWQSTTNFIYTDRFSLQFNQPKTRLISKDMADYHQYWPL